MVGSNKLKVKGGAVSVPSPHVIYFASGVVCLLLAADVAVHSAHATPQQEAPKVLTAQEFRLVDKTGAPKATLGLQPDGSPYLSLSDKSDKRRITLRIRPDGGSAFAINDADGKNRIALDTQADGSASITLSSSKGKGGAGFLSSADGTPVVIVKDKDGTVAFAEPQPEPPADPDPAKQPLKK